MRLTNSMRDAFIRSAMNDVPRIDHDEQAQGLISAETEKLFAATFPGVDYKKLKDAGWLNSAWLDTPRGLRSCYVNAPNGCRQFVTPELDQQLTQLGIAAIAQEKQRSELESKLRAVAYSVTTREALAKALPEFEKYLPEAPDTVAKNLPAVANLVADFTKAGWPKGKEPAELLSGA